MKNKNMKTTTATVTGIRMFMFKDASLNNIPVSGEMSAGLAGITSEVKTQIPFMRSIPQIRSAMRFVVDVVRTSGAWCILEIDPRMSKKDRTELKKYLNRNFLYSDKPYMWGDAHKYMALGPGSVRLNKGSYRVTGKMSGYTGITMR